jgi:hypothetical protein
MSTVDRHPPSLRLVLLVTLAAIVMLAIMPAWFDFMAAVAAAVSWCMWLDQIEHTEQEDASEPSATKSPAIKPV